MNRVIFRLPIFILTILMSFSSASGEVVMDGKGRCWIDQVEYPAVAFGTYPLTGEVAFQATSKAAEIGYRIIDTATFYQNFIPLGHVLKQYGRNRFYVISKVWPDSQTADGVVQDLNRTLEQLQTDYLDAYLIHWPNHQIPIEETLGVMNQLRLNNKIRHIGLSNVTVNHLKRALELNIPITWVQVEMNPSFYDEDLVAFCQQNGIGVQAWGPLGSSSGAIRNDKFLAKIGKKYGKTASQVALRWVVQHKCLPLPNSKNEKHLKQNLDIMNFSLTNEEMAAIDKRARKGNRTRVSFDEFDYSYEQCWPKKPM